MDHNEAGAEAVRVSSVRSRSRKPSRSRTFCVQRNVIIGLVAARACDAPYDRLFPSQDTLPKGGFGNLIALPFQFHPRKLGHSLFVDDRFEAFPWAQQWQFLAGIERVEADRVRALAKEAVRTGRVLGVPQASLDDEEDDEPWKPKPPPAPTPRLPFAIPPEVKAVLAQRLFVEKAGLPPPLVSRLRRLAAFQNPEFYKRQKLRLSTARTPRIVVCAEDLPKHLALPRACVDDVRDLLEGERLAPGLR